jgi:hypothetical protein
MREDFAARDVVDNEDQPAAVILVRPVVEPFRREHRMLSRLYHGRPLRAVGKAYDPFDPQQVGAALAGESPERAGEIEPAQLAFENHTESIDAVGMDGDRLGRT